jgi:predicted glycosyltransferase
MRSRNTPLRILCYAVNGLGLGHLTRLVAICRQLRRLATVLELPVEILFLTSSEGEALAGLHGFATFKIPSKTQATACELDPHRYRKIARQWIWNAANLISPDLLLVDTFPAGSFNELPGLLDLGTKNVFIYREVRPEVASQPTFQSALGLYDLILRIDEGSGSTAPETVPPELEDCVSRVGPVLLRSASETYDRPAARELLGLPPAGRAVYVSVGGGGDRDAESLLRSLATAAAALPEVRFVIGAGLLYRGREWTAPNVMWTRRPVLVECFRAFDAAITAGGFNTVWELMHCGVPCLFLPLPRGWDDQESRVARCVAAGAGRLLPSREPGEIVAALRELLRDEVLEGCAAAATRLLPHNHALGAAEEILSVAVDRGRIDEAALLLDPGPLFAAARGGIPERDLLQIAALISAKANGGRDAEHAEASLAAAERLLRHLLEHGAATRQARPALKRTERRETPEEVAAAAIQAWEEGRQL